MALWIEALESGDYRQGKTVLHNLETDTWCCLGVACKVALDNGLSLEIDSRSFIPSTETFDTAGAYLPLRVQQWLGLDDDWGNGCNPLIAGRAATWWNDQTELNFEGIAWLLRREYLTNV